jgi:SAM-dependent methyltransferase
MPAGSDRQTSFGQEQGPSAVDRFGVWLSGRQIRSHVEGGFAGKRVGDFGCGFEATFGRTILGEAERVTLMDIAVADDLRSHPRVTAIEGTLPEALGPIGDASLDVVMCTSVLEHLWEPLFALEEFRRIVAPGGTCLFNVPSWAGKRLLEFSAFRLGTSPAQEMDDHKMYYDPKDFWPLLVRAGFVPHGIKCFRHKFGLNTFAVCRVDPMPSGSA